jgi:hypothetical protein
MNIVSFRDSVAMNEAMHYISARLYGGASNSSAYIRARTKCCCTKDIYCATLSARFYIIYSWFNDSVSYWDDTALNDWMRVSNELKMMWKQAALS